MNVKRGIDTEDAEWLFCEHPGYPGLFLATGDSGHSFTSLPVVGGQVVDLLEGKVSRGDGSRHEGNTS